jgi:hypothetical protein
MSKRVPRILFLKDITPNVVIMTKRNSNSKLESMKDDSQRKRLRTENLRYMYLDPGSLRQPLAPLTFEQVSKRLKVASDSSTNGLNSVK